MAYKRAKNIEVGSIVEIPTHRWSQTRAGWNGWFFALGIVERLYTSKTGERCAVVKYCAKTCGRYDLLPCTYAEKRVLLDWCFDPAVTIACQKRHFPELEEAEKNGEPVCWSEDVAFMVDNGMLEYWKKPTKEGQ